MERYWIGLYYYLEKVSLAAVGDLLTDEDVCIAVGEVKLRPDPGTRRLEESVPVWPLEMLLRIIGLIDQ